jgi:hypothetical protein
MTVGDTIAVESNPSIRRGPMQPQTEQQLLQVLQQIAQSLQSINNKLAPLQTVPTHLSNIAAKTGR